MNVDLKTFPLQANPVAKFYSESGTLVDTETGTESATVKGTYRFTPTLADGYYDYTIALPGDGSSAGAIQVSGQVVVNDGDTIAQLKKQSTQSAVVNVLPFTGSTPDRTNGTTIKVFIGEAASVSVSLDGADVDDMTLSFAIEDGARNDIATISNGDIARSGSTFTVTIPNAVTGKVARYRWALRDITASANLVLGQGVLEIAYAADIDE